MFLQRAALYLTEIFAPNIASENDLVFGFRTQASRYARKLVSGVSLELLVTLPKRGTQRVRALRTVWNCW